MYKYICKNKRVDLMNGFGRLGFIPPKYSPHRGRGGA
jgi:hypothetical protein